MTTPPAVAGASRFVRDRYLTLDRRVLGAFRIWFGLVMLADVLGRLAHATFFYSNSGCLSNHFSMFDPIARPGFSIFNCLSSPSEAKLGLILTAVVFACYMVGYRTRLAQLLSFFLYTSLNSRNLLLENGGTVLVGVLCAWTLLLPLGQRYSVDAFLARMRRGGAADPSADTPLVTLAALGIALQIAVIYTFNVLHKTGWTWGSGQAIHYVLWQSHFATPVAAWLRMHETPWMSPVLTKATLVIEGLAPILVLSPFAQRVTRTLNLLLITALHGGIAICLSIGPFSYVMFALNLLLLPKEAVDRVERWFSGGEVAKMVERLDASLAARWTSTFGGAGEPGAPAPLRQEVRTIVREGWIVVLMVAIGIEVTLDNEAIPPRYRLEEPPVLAQLIDYPRLHQGWHMFSPDAPETNSVVVVDAVTADRRHIDPLTGKRPDLDAPIHGPSNRGTFFCDYLGRIPDFGDYQPELKKYLMNWQEVEGRPAGDRIVSLTAYRVTSESPLPGEKAPRNVNRSVLFTAP